MKKSWKASHSPSMRRSRVKKHYGDALPTKVMYDPFIGARFYYNKNGRPIKILPDGRRKAIG